MNLQPVGVEFSCDLSHVLHITSLSLLCEREPKRGSDEGEAGKQTDNGNAFEIRIL